MKGPEKPSGGFVAGLLLLVMGTPVAMADPPYASDSADTIQSCSNTAPAPQLGDAGLIAIEVGNAQGHALQINWHVIGGEIGCEIHLLPTFVDPDDVIIVPRIISYPGGVIADMPLDVTAELRAGRRGAGPTSLSGAQRQRVTIGRALDRKPDIVVLDEALSEIEADDTRIELGISWAPLDVSQGGGDAVYSIEPPSSLLEAPTVDGVRLFETEGPLIDAGELRNGRITGGVSDGSRFKPAFPNGYPGFPKSAEELQAFILATVIITSKETDIEMKDQSPRPGDAVFLYEPDGVWELFEPVCISNEMRREDCRPIFQNLVTRFGPDVVAYHALLGWDRFEEAEMLAKTLNEADIKAAKRMMESTLN